MLQPKPLPTETVWSKLFEVWSCLLIVNNVLAWIPDIWSRYPLATLELQQPNIGCSLQKAVKSSDRFTDGVQTHQIWLLVSSLHTQIASSIQWAEAKVCLEQASEEMFFRLSQVLSPSSSLLSNSGKDDYGKYVSQCVDQDKNCSQYVYW